MHKDFHPEFEYAKIAVLDASKIVLSYFQKEFSVSYKEGELSSSIVTQADGETETLIRTTLESKFPDYGFIGEETAELNKEIAWVVDPIDGTLAFSRGLFDFGMALALKRGSDVIFTIMYLPSQSKLYYAYRGEGAFVNDSKINVSKTTLLKSSIISLHQKGANLQQFQDLAKTILQNSTVRMSHSSVVESCYVAEGKIDGLIKFEQKIWDIAPESLLMQEAGARVTDEFGEPLMFNFSKSSRQTFIALSPTITDSKELYLSLS